MILEYFYVERPLGSDGFFDNPLIAINNVLTGLQVVMLFLATADLEVEHRGAHHCGAHVNCTGGAVFGGAIFTKLEFSGALFSIKCTLNAPRCGACFRKFLRSVHFL